jgi:hypothetical protein
MSQAISEPLDFTELQYLLQYIEFKRASGNVTRSNYRGNSTVDDWVSKKNEAKEKMMDLEKRIVPADLDANQREALNKVITDTRVLTKQQKCFARRVLGLPEDVPTTETTTSLADSQFEPVANSPSAKCDKQMAKSSVAPTCTESSAKRMRIVGKSDATAVPNPALPSKSALCAAEKKDTESVAANATDAANPVEKPKTEVVTAN